MITLASYPVVIFLFVFCFVFLAQAEHPRDSVRRNVALSTEAVFRTNITSQSVEIIARSGTLGGKDKSCVESLAAKHKYAKIAKSSYGVHAELRKYLSPVARRGSES